MLRSIGVNFVCTLAVLVWGSLSLAQEEKPPAEVSSDEEIEAKEKPAHDPHNAGDHGEKDHSAGDHGAAHGHIGAKGASSDPAEVKGDLAIFTLLIFVLLFAILYKFAWSKISAALDAREKGIRENIEAAQRANEEGKALLAQYEQKLADAQGEVKAIIEEARRDAEHTQQEILARARADAQVERDRSLHEIETATDQALKELAEKSTNLAVDLAAKIMQAQVKKSDHDRLIQDAVATFSRGMSGKN